jgi:hypothetical protein
VTATAPPIDWYEVRDELMPGQIFLTKHGDRIMLDRRIPGDGTDWYCADWWNDTWSYMETKIHPSDLVQLLGHED